ncbi:MAG: Protein-arginine kinase [Fimbriimonadaceae bacterium]|nr:Protein-arginine kinase [Fimbriimonadaceae bacterium]
MVLRAASEPFWLNADAPNVAVVMSSRARVARNLWGFAFPHRLDERDRTSVQSLIIKACRDLGWELQTWSSLSPSEEELFVAARLISPYGDHQARSRTILLDRARSLTVMVNEEDHIRLQALHPGWSLAAADKHADRAAQNLETEMRFARTAAGDYLTASPVNVGAATRHSIMCHLFALAQMGKVKPMIEALGFHDWVVRGVFGESSRAVGAFFQVSTTRGLTPGFLGACEHLIQAELEARSQLDADRLSRTCADALRFGVTARKLKLSEAIRCLSWVRWARYSGLFEEHDRTVDRMISGQGSVRSLETGRETADRERAATLRTYFELCLRNLKAPRD